MCVCVCVCVRMFVRLRVSLARYISNYTTLNQHHHNLSALSVWPHPPPEEAVGVCDGELVQSAVQLGHL